MKTTAFAYDVFLSYSSKDKEVVHSLAKRLQGDGLRVWLDVWEIQPGDSIPSKIEAGLETSSILVFCMSSNAFGSDWAALERHTFRFRDPLNSERRFIPLRLDDSEPRGSLHQFAYVDWRYKGEQRDSQYRRLLEACRPSVLGRITGNSDDVARLRLKGAGAIRSTTLSPDEKYTLSGFEDGTVKLSDIESGQPLRVLEGHTGGVTCVAFSPDGKYVLSGSDDRTIRLWETDTGTPLKVFRGHTGRVSSVSFSPNGKRTLSGDDRTLRVWEVETGVLLRVLDANVQGASWRGDGKRVISGSRDRMIRVWEVETGRLLWTLEGHADEVTCVTFSPDGDCALSGSLDRTLRLWDVKNGRTLRVLEGHVGGVSSVAWSHDGKRVLSGSDDHSVRLWDVESGRALRVLNGHTSLVKSVTFNLEDTFAFSADQSGVWSWWNLAKLTGSSVSTAIGAEAALDQVQYTNAKVLLVGESGTGKTGLSMRLALGTWEPTDSTVGAWATQWKLPAPSTDGVEREIWLWDFGGQADQRLIHQLYMEDTSVAVLVFDGQNEDLFEILGQWDRDLERSTAKPYAKLLAAGRVDAGGLRTSRDQIEAFKEERGFAGYFETSAKSNEGCPQLKEAILAAIQWPEIPWRTSPRLFKRLKDEILRLKDDGRCLVRFNELRDTLRLRLACEDVTFNDQELQAVLGLLAGPGLVWELPFGKWVLLQPERINAYAQAVIQTLRTDRLERGSILEERVLRGDLPYHSSMERLETEEERFVLLGMHHILVERGLCLREHTDNGTLLVFPSYYRRERLNLVVHPAVLVTYQFTGFLDDIYATLVVRLHHTQSFQQDQLWRYAADFKTHTGKQLGIKLTRLTDGAGKLEVYFDSQIPVEEKIIFSRYIHEHLLQKGQDVVRLRHYVCPNPRCNTPVGNHEVPKKKLEEWLAKKEKQKEKEDKTVTHESAANGIKGWFSKKDMPTIICIKCERRMPLWDDLEQCFADPGLILRVQELQKESATVLDNESKERALVGEVISTVSLAGQIVREFTVSDHGVDMEIEFTSDYGEPTGEKIYLQLKPGNSYWNQQRGKAEVLVIKSHDHIRYWMKQPCPVMLMLRNSQGEVRWMDVRDWLNRATADTEQPINQIIFEGERFDVMSVRRCRDKMLAKMAKAVSER